MDPSDVAASPAPLLALPTHFTFHGPHLSYLSPTNTSTSKSLSTLPLTSPTPTVIFGTGENSESNLSEAEKLRRERMRNMSTGVTGFHLLAGERGGKTVTYLLPTPNGLSTFSPATPTTPSTLNPIYTGTPVDIQTTSTNIYFAQNSDVHCLLPTTPPQSVQLTFSPPLQTSGLADFLSQEEMDQYRGYWLLSSHLLYLSVDDTPVPEFTIMHSGKPTPTGEGNEEKHHYPFSGCTNPKVKLMLMQLNPKGSDSQRLANFKSSLQLLPPSEDCSEYICRIHTFHNFVFAQWQNRAQTILKLVCYDISSSNPAQPEVVLTEKTETWINLHHIFRIISAKTSPVITFIWAMYYSCNSVSPLEKRLCCSKITGGTHHVVTQEIGVHNVTMSSDCRHYVDVYSSRTQPPIGVLKKIVPTDYIKAVQNSDPSNATTTVTTFHSPTPDSITSKVSTERSSFLHMLRPPSLSSFLNRTSTKLYYSLYLPDKSKHGSGPYPLIVACYGGPHVQRVSETWSQNVDMRVQMLRSYGVAVVKCDNRGSSRRGLEFEGSVKWNMGEEEVNDQVDLVKHLTSLKIADPERVGIYGWSYGGYMAAMCLAKANDVFHVGVSGAPVTSWDGYDTHYTERYMGTPQENEEVRSCEERSDELEMR
ncbi:hypothetical protein TL16_g12781 [Triparma laevis f. inornata]|uniref:Peptidase S9 prolyl oligopeptidase catalytic domain-containing protein n=1 Tax=Triparma laevis f. inornata TaxID=1714386 RepID=A0A9W7BP48_9STRA|nr:hypothetical protein TL16_g12781 [Triparma laevis f. inornata]